MPTVLSTKQLDDRDWTQIKAALTLWLTVLRNSRTHPAMHSNIEPMFEHVAPLEADDIERLIEGMEYPPYVTREQVAEMLGCGITTAGLKLRGAGVKPIGPKGTHLYRTAEVVKIDNE